MSLRALAVFFAIACCAAPGIAAADADDYSRFGFYAGLGPTLVVPLFEDEFEDFSGAPVTVDKSVGLVARFGLRVLPFLGADLQYEGVKGYDVNFADGTHFRMDSHTLTVNGKLYVPFWRIQPYAMAGIGFVHYDIHQRFELKGGGSFAFGGRVGGGLDFYLTRSVVLNGEVSVVLADAEMVDTPPGAAVDGLHYLSAGLGLTYRF